MIMSFIKKLFFKREGIGIDLGIKTYATLSDGTIYRNFNKNNNIKELEKQKKIYISRNKIKQATKIDRKLLEIRRREIEKIVTKIINKKPAYITIETLCFNNICQNIKAMIDVLYLDYFKQCLIEECCKNHIELRIVPRNFPSSKTCSKCGNIKKDLTLNDRVYICKKCRCRMDRDLNASLNLKNAKKYKIIAK